MSLSSARMTTEDFLYPAHCLLRVCFGKVGTFDTVMVVLGLEISYRKIGNKVSNKQV